MYIIRLPHTTTNNAPPPYVAHFGSHFPKQHFFWSYVFFKTKKKVQKQKIFFSKADFLFFLRAWSLSRLALPKKVFKEFLFKRLFNNSFEGLRRQKEGNFGLVFKNIFREIFTKRAENSEQGKSEGNKGIKRKWKRYGRVFGPPNDTFKTLLKVVKNLKLAAEWEWECNDQRKN